MVSATDLSSILVVLTVIAGKHASVRPFQSQRMQGSPGTPSRGLSSTPECKVAGISLMKRTKSPKEGRENILSLKSSMFKSLKEKRIWHTEGLQGRPARPQRDRGPGCTWGTGRYQTMQGL